VTDQSHNAEDTHAEDDEFEDVDVQTQTLGTVGDALK
jgi:hypothetical protein